MMRARILIGLTCILMVSMAVTAAPLGSAFTYQGQLKDGGIPTDGLFTMEFKLFDADTLGNQVGPTLTFDGGGNPQVSVTNGLFTVDLDFGAAAYDGNARWLEITVNWTPLSPRQALTATPHARYAAAPWETNGGDISYSGGNVGIGTTSPAAPLSFGPNDANTKLALWEDGTYFLGLGVGPAQFRLHLPASNNRFSFLDAPAGNEIMTIKGTGNVGIGTTTPSGKFEVFGAIDYDPEAIDQQQGTANASTTGGSCWQSFTVGQTGRMTKIEVLTDCPVQIPFCSGGGTFRLYTGTGASGPELRQQGVSLTGYSYRTFNLSPPVEVVAGEVYTVALTASGPDPWIVYHNGNPYAGGISNLGAGSDLAFRTTVSPWVPGSQFIVNSGKVGIGTASPLSVLSLGSSIADTKLTLWDDGPGGSNPLGIGIGNAQFRLHLSQSDNRFSFFDAPAGNEIMTIMGTGNVGIGSTNPLSRLEVVTGGGTTTSLWCEHGGSNLIVRPVSAGGTATVVENTGGGGLCLNPAGGNVGIGTTSPNRKLHVHAATGAADIRISSADSQAAIYLDSDNGGDAALYSPDNTNDLRFYVGLADRLHIGSDGNVGIGTNAPTQKLQVVGNVLANGLYHSTGSIHGNDAARLKSGGAGHSISVKSEPGGAITIWNDNIGNFKSFIIDHPDDPAKHLVHVAIEGPEVAVFYRGSARLKDGRARIELPAYFESLTDPEGQTIQITNVDGFDRLAVRSRDGAKIVNGAFEVYADNARSGQAFDWEVKARRRDGKSLVVEPNRTDIEVRGDGPYTYSVPRTRVADAAPKTGGAR